jgi:PPK2 family polyphosphate:nucleotide phosphotransferase
MLNRSDLVSHFRVKPGRRVNLKKWATDAADLRLTDSMDDDELKEMAVKGLERIRKELAEAQERLWAADSHSVLIILQAIDAAGKDGTIRHVMSGVNPQGCRVVSFKAPSQEDLEHNFLWRTSKQLPERGMIGIFNRSYYEETLVVRVRPELLEYQRLPGKVGGKKFWKARFDDINNFERHLTRNGTVILKFFLHLSKDEQKKRFLERLTNPEKYWKFSHGDLTERERWDDYQQAFEETMSQTSTEWAPWHIIPADRKPVTRAIVAATIIEAINDLKIKFPKLTEEEIEALNAARIKLESE